MKNRLIIIGVILIGIAVAICARQNGIESGYAQGWLDAACGVGRTCEAGQQ